MKRRNLHLFISLFVLSFFGALQSVKAQTDPTLLFAKGIGNEYIGGGDLSVSCIKLDASGNRYVTGSFSATADFDPSSATANLVSSGGADIFIAKYDATGNYLWAKGMGGASDELGNSLVLDGSGNVYVTGYFAGTVDFDPSASAANLTSAGDKDIFVAKYNSSGNYVWAKGIGATAADYGYSLTLDGSENLILTGYFSGIADFDPSASTANLTSGGGTDIFIAKYNSSGNYLWAKGVWGAGGDSGNSLALDGSGNVYVTGYFNSTVDFDPSSTATANMTSAGGNDIFIAKYDASGNYIWAKGIGGAFGDQGNSLALDGSDNVFVTGSFYGTVDFDPSSSTFNLVDAGNVDIFVAKYDAFGNYIWAKRMGGTSGDYATSLALDGNGNVHVTGYFSGTVDFDPSSTATANLLNAGLYDIFVAKYDASGNYLWAKGMGGTGNDQGLSLALNGSVNVLVTGKFAGTADFDPSAGTANLVAGTGTLNNGFISSYTIASGTYNSALLLGGYTLVTSARSHAVVKDGMGNIYLTGYFDGTVDFDPSSTATANMTSAGNTDIFIAKYDASGNYVWAKGMGGTTGDMGNSLALDNSGNVFLTGNFAGTADFDPGSSTANLVSSGGLFADIFVAKYDASGNYIWAKRIGGSSFDAGNFLTLDGSGDVYVTGYFNGTVDFDPSSSTANLVSGGTFDIFVSKYDASGNYIWAKGMGGTGNDRGNSLALDGSRNVFVTGFFNSTADFDPSSTATANLVSAGSDGIFVAKYDASGNYVWAKGMGGINSDKGNSIALDGSSNVFVTGFFSGTVDFDPSSTTTADLVSDGGYDIFIAKYDASGNYVWAIMFGRNR